MNGQRSVAFTNLVPPMHKLALPTAFYNNISRLAVRVTVSLVNSKFNYGTCTSWHWQSMQYRCENGRGGLFLYLKVSNNDMITVP